MLFHGDIPYAKIWYAYVTEQRQSCQSHIHGENIEIKGQGHTEVIQRSWMYTTHCTMVIHSHSMTMWKDKRYLAWTQSHVMNPINLTLRSKVNVVSGIINVQDTSSHSDRTMCQIWLANIKTKQRYGPDTNLHIQSDRSPDGRTEWFLYTTWILLTVGIIKMVAINSLTKFEFRKRQ